MSDYTLYVYSTPVKVNDWAHFEAVLYDSEAKRIAEFYDLLEALSVASLLNAKVVDVANAGRLIVGEVTYK